MVVTFSDDEFQGLRLFCEVLCGRYFRVLFFGLLPSLHYPLLFLQELIIGVDESAHRGPPYLWLVVRYGSVPILFFVILVIILLDLIWGNFLGRLANLFGSFN